jgi:hypothetical protein
MAVLGRAIGAYDEVVDPGILELRPLSRRCDQGFRPRRKDNGHTICFGDSASPQTHFKSAASGARGFFPVAFR